MNTGINEIMDDLDQMYQDKKAEWDGSLVTGVATDGSGSKPIIKLPGLTDSDVGQFISKKMTELKSSLSIFP